jgi:signal transduction histidine kinase
LGNISVACDESLRPEEFHFLKVFFGLVANLLAMNRAHETAAGELALAKDQAHRLSLALLSHNLGTRVAGLQPLISLYEDLEPVGGPELADLNRLFRVGYEDMANVLSKAKETFQNAPPRLQRGDVLQMVDRVIGDALAGEEHRVTGCRPMDADFDPLQMTSAIKEIVHNAIEFAPKDSIAIDVQLDGGGACELVRVVISDGGPGVSEDMKPRIFGDFFTHRPNKHPSSGLGLALVRRVAENHGGHAYEDGIPLKGARFVLEFPRFGGGRLEKR